MQEKGRAARSQVNRCLKGPESRKVLVGLGVPGNILSILNISCVSH